MAQGSFVGLPVATLTNLRDKFVSCLEAIAVAGVSYSIGGRSFSRANLTEVRNTLEEINYAIGLANGTKKINTFAKFGP